MTRSLADAIGEGAMANDKYAMFTLVVAIPIKDDGTLDDEFRGLRHTIVEPDGTTSSSARRSLEEIHDSLKNVVKDHFRRVEWKVESDHRELKGNTP